MTDTNIKVLFYFPTAFGLSETFLYKQLKNPKITPTIITNEICNSDLFQLGLFDITILPTIPLNLKDRVLSKYNRSIRRCDDYALPHSTENILLHYLKINPFKVIHINYGISAIKLFPVLKKVKLPYIIHFHGYDASQLLNEKTYCRKLRSVLKAASKVIIVSSDMAERLSPLDLPINRTEVIPYGVDEKILNYSKARNNGSIVRILHAGRLTPKKGTLDLVKVFDELKSEFADVDYELNIIGDGEERIKIEEYLKFSNNRASIKLLGSLPHEEVINYMRESDIFVLNSRTASNGDMEGFPNSLIEAMACGCSVLSTYHAGIPDAITNQYNGLLVKEYDNFNLKLSLKELIRNNNLRQKLSQNAKKTVKSEYTQSIMLGRYYNIYQELR